MAQPHAFFRFLDIIHGRGEDLVYCEGKPVGRRSGPTATVRRDTFACNWPAQSGVSSGSSRDVRPGMSETTEQQTPTARRGGSEAPDDPDPARRLWSLWRQGQQPRVADFLDQAGVRVPEEIVMALRVDQAERCRLGQWVPAEEYLAAFSAVRDDPAATVDLVFAEFLLREEQGERPPLEEFLHRFPQYAEELKLQIALHREMDGDRAPTAAGAGAAATLPVEGGTASVDRPTGYGGDPISVGEHFGRRTGVSAGDRNAE
jgi:hypothetical protein